ncbi:hypothetical protein A3K63_03245 [Candidatus Micrarchaeota archaeon RBG_16_49_10]|nr:MAG: hypothetical protein A3K63_03245 [Candidatus Micrarchaeota archaeon RBG_16_49_10]
MGRRKVVILGGGSGPLATLELADYDYDITVISSVADDGGSTGKILEGNPQILPPGDIRRAISHSSRNELFSKDRLESRISYDCPVESPTLRSLLGYYGDEAYASEVVRAFQDFGNRGAVDEPLEIENLKGHPLGNLMLAALMLNRGNAEGVKMFCRMAETSVDVLPASETPTTFCFMDREMKKPSNGEHLLDDPQRQANPIETCWLDPWVEPYRKALKAIDEADAVIISPTSFYANMITILLIPEFAGALKDKLVIWVGNIMTEWNQTAYSEFALTGIGHMDLLKKYLERYPDAVLAPKMKRQELGEVFGNYEREGASPVLYRRRDFEEKGIRYTEKDDMIDIVEEYDNKGVLNNVLRHRPDKVAEYLDAMLRKYL